MRLSNIHEAVNLRRALEIIYGARTGKDPGILDSSRQTMPSPYDEFEWSSLEQAGKDAFRSRPKEIQLNRDQLGGNDGLPTNRRYRRYFGISD